MKMERSDSTVLSRRTSTLALACALPLLCSTLAAQPLLDPQDTLKRINHNYNTLKQECQEPDTGAPRGNVGASLLAKAMLHSALVLTGSPLSRASSLPQGFMVGLRFATGIKKTARGPFFCWAKRLSRRGTPRALSGRSAALRRCLASPRGRSPERTHGQRFSAPGWRSVLPGTPLHRPCAAVR